MLNQVFLVSPDYVLCPKDRVNEFVEEVKAT